MATDTEHNERMMQALTSMNISLHVELPIGTAGPRHFEFAFQLDAHAYRKSFAPLPRDRELSWAIESQLQEKRMREERNALAKWIAEKLARQLVDFAAEG